MRPSGEVRRFALRGCPQAPTPSRRETMQSTLVVILMVLVVGIYLMLLDKLWFWTIYDLVLGLGN